MCRQVCRKDVMERSEMESFRNACNRFVSIVHSSGMRQHQCPLNAKSHPAGMRICYAIFAGISLRLCSISLRSFRITFAAYLPTHIKSLRDFFNHYQIITGTTCISPPKLFNVGGTKPCHSFYCAGAECFLFSFSPLR